MPSVPPPALVRLDRRHLLGGSLGVVAAAGIVASDLGDPASAVDDLPRWSDPATWGGAVPGPDRQVVVAAPILLDQDARVAGLDIDCGGRLVFDPTQSVVLRSTANVTVCGTLEMRPADARVDHGLLFEEIDEAAFQGGGMEVLDSDVGLWIHHDGTLDLNGTPRTAWVRAAGSLRRGDRSVRLLATPTGWRVGDELAISPTGSPVDLRHFEKFDLARVEAISGNLVVLDRGLRYGHPRVDVGDGYRLTAEVMNLTRNVRIEGTPQGRTHTMALGVTQPSRVRYASFRHFGPRQGDGADSVFVPGRYGFHWHMSDDGSRGSLLEGVVMRDGGSHAYVTHLSNGVTHRSCISYDTAETPYWWDGPQDTRSPAPPTDDVLYSGCVAARVRAIPDFRGYRMSGFDLGQGQRNVARGCVAVGVRGNVDASGFQWPEGAHGVWDFADCVSHNNACHGIFAWQNSELRHVVEKFVAYHNGGFGVSHGAYRNGYLYRDAVIYGNAQGGVELHAVSAARPRLALWNLLIDCAGHSSHAVEVVGHRLPADAATQIAACRLVGYTHQGLGLSAARPAGELTHPDRIDVSGCRFSANWLWISDKVARRGTRVRVGDSSRALVARHRSIRPGRLRRRWNARVRRGTPFSRSISPGPIDISIARRSPG